MKTISIRNKDIYKIEEESMEQPLYGGDQDWYGTRWQRMSGCGPTTVANIIYYLSRTRGLSECHAKLTKKECMELMDEIWNYVTPTINGISSAGMLHNCVRKYLDKKKLDIKLDILDVPKKKPLRPDFSQVLVFLSKALSNDSPVAYLNLDHGTIEELESWHWVTIISLEYEEGAGPAYVEILDGGLIKQINLCEWYKTTRLGGGFVSFEIQKEAQTVKLLH